MLLLQVLSLNVLIIIAMAVLGWLPTRYLENRVGTMNPGFRLFSSVFLGYILVQSAYALWITKGMSMQILNFLPFVLMGFLPAHPKETLDSKSLSLRDIFIPLGVVLVSGLYFLYSYSHDFTKIDRYPFIDLVSYAASAYGMGQAKAEVYFSDMALYFPGMTRLNLYHFTELWFTRLLVDCTGLTEIWIFCFVIPVFSFGLLSLGLLAIPESRKIPALFLFVLILSFFFALGKLLFFQDVFIYHILDLFGQKIALLIPTLLFLWGLRNNRNVLLLFLLVLPQINILFGILLAILALIGFFFWADSKKKSLPPTIIWLGYSAFVLVFLFILKTGSGTSSGKLELSAFSPFLAAKIFFTYCREALFNLGYNYWIPFIVIAAIFRSRLYAIFIVPYAIAKVAGQIPAHFFLALKPFQAGFELLICLLGLWWIHHRLYKFPQLATSGLLLIFLLCGIGSVGYALTGFMDFEQIYTLVACSFFFLLTFCMFLVPGPEKHPPLFSKSFSPYLLAACLLLLVWKTIRFQRVLPFDSEFYDIVQKEAASVTKSVYFSTMRYSPFPLHVKAGFPLLFSFDDAHSTPITQFEDSSWHGSNVSWHVKQYPFYYFCEQKENNGFSLEQNKVRFMKKFGIRFAWIDADYPKEKVNFLRPAVEKTWRSEKDKKELWKLDPEKLP